MLHSLLLLQRDCTRSQVKQWKASAGIPAYSCSGRSPCPCLSVNPISGLGCWEFGTISGYRTAKQAHRAGRFGSGSGSNHSYLRRTRVRNRVRVRVLVARKVSHYVLHEYHTGQERLLHSLLLLQLDCTCSKVNQWKASAGSPAYTCSRRSPCPCLSVNPISGLGCWEFGTISGYRTAKQAQRAGRFGSGSGSNHSYLRRTRVRVRVRVGFV